MDGRSGTLANWSTRNYEIHGFEVKAIRADWLAELSDPQKAEAGAQYCDRWWVCAALGVVQRSELPKGWGLLQPSGNGLREVVKAGTRPSKQPPRQWWIYLMRKVAQKDAPEVVKKAVDEAYAQGERYGKDQHRWRVEQVERDDKRLREAIAQFEKASGIEFSAWEAGKIGAAVKVVLEQANYVRIVGFNFRNVEREQKALRDALIAAGWDPSKEEP